MGNKPSKNVDTATDYARHQQFANVSVEENKNEGNRPAIMSTPIVNPKVIKDASVSPVEFAKAYMASRTPKVFPSVLGMSSHVREDNSFIAPRSRYRSKNYNMARTPYSKAHLSSNLNLKGSGISSNGDAAPSMSSSVFSPMQSGEKSESRRMRLKRKRIWVFGDELGSVSPIRRLRQKPNLVASRIHKTTNGEGIISHPNQEPLLIGENEKESVPTSESNGVASKILEHLEKTKPKETAPFTLTPSMLSGQAHRSLEDVDTSKWLLDVKDDYKLGDGSNDTLADVNNFSTQNQEKEVGPKKYVSPLDKLNSVPNNDSVSDLESSMPSTSATDFIAKTGASQPNQRKRPFRMIVEEYFEQDDEHCDGTAPGLFSEKKGPMETSPTNEVASPEEPKRVKPSIQPADESHFPSISRKTSEESAPEEETNAANFPQSAPVEKVDSESNKEAELKIESSSSSQGLNPSSAFGFTSSSTISAREPAVKFGANPTEVTAASSGIDAFPISAVGSSTASANSSASVPVTDTATSLISGTSSIFTFGDAPNSSSVFGSTPAFGSSALTSPSPSTVFAFGALAPAASSSTPSVFNNPSSSGPAFSFTSASPSILSSPSAFGNPNRGFGAPDSMAEDNIVQTSVAAFPVFGQQMASSTPSTPYAFGFGSASTASQPNPFTFGGQQPNQGVAPQQSPSPFQFNTGVNFSLGIGGGDKSGQKSVKTNRNKYRKK